MGPSPLSYLCAIAEQTQLRPSESLTDRGTENSAAELAGVRGDILCASGRYLEGEEDVRGALAVREASLPSRHWLIMSTRSRLGLCLIGRSRFAEAEKLLLDGHAYFMAERGAQTKRRWTRKPRSPVYKNRGQTAISANVGTHEQRQIRSK